MEHRLRLAERQGLLQGKGLSRVQFLAIELLMVADARERNRSFVNDFKMQLGAANPDMLKHLFPDAFGDTETKTQDEIMSPSEEPAGKEVAAEDFDPEANQAWTYTDEVDEEQAHQLLQEAQARGWTMTGEDLDEEEPPEWI